MKYGLLFLLGWTPLLVGTGVNALATGPMRDAVPPYALIALALLLVWGLFGLLSAKLGVGRRAALVALHIPAALVLALLLVQELALIRYWPNMIGVGTQFFYLPLINLGVSLIRWFSHTISMAPVYLICFLLLCALGVLGRLIGEKFFENQNNA